MTHLSERYLKTGGDPRTLPDYAALRDELGKLTHPARPDVNWNRVETLCVSLFEHNGVELQTAAWFTQARMQLAGLAGLNEGLAILEALVSHQWGSLWPQQVHARVEILSALSRRIQQMMRTLPVSYADLSQLYHAEQQLNRLNGVLQRLELRHLSQFDALAALMHTSAVRLENSDAGPGSHSAAEGSGVAAASMPRRVEAGLPLSAPAGLKRVYVAQTHPEPAAGVQAAPGQQASRRWSFAAGALTMLLAGAAGVAGWQLLLRPDPLELQLRASLAPLPLPLSDLQLSRLPRNAAQPEKLAGRTQQQLARISALPAGWSLEYGQQLLRQAQALQPEDAATRQMVSEWQQQVAAAALPAEAMAGWQQGMAQLQQLTARLNALDVQRGKYITVSELKSVVYNASEAFSRAIPAEEQLRRYSLSQSAIQRRQLEMALEQLQNRYFLIRHGGATVPGQSGPGQSAASVQSAE